MNFESLCYYCFSVPNEIDSTTAVYPDTSYYNIGSDITLNCSIRYIKSTYIDVITRVHIKWMPGGVSANTVLHKNTSHSLQYTVHNFQLSQAGQYKCLYFIDTAESNFYINPSVTKSDAINIAAISKYRKLLKTFINCFCYFIVPINSTSLVLNDLQPHYEVGSNVTLTCFVTKSNPHHVDINTTVNIKWSSHKRTSNQYSSHSYNENLNHILTKLKLSDAGEYNCSYYLTSTTNNLYIKQSNVNANTTHVTIKSKLNFKVIIYSFEVPKGNYPSIAPLPKTFGISSFINLTCYATYLNTSLIDVATYMNIRWLNPSNHTLHTYTGINDYTEHTLNYTISNVKLSDAGQYTCQYNVSSNNSFVITSDVMTAVTNVSVQSKSILCRM